MFWTGEDGRLRRAELFSPADVDEPLPGILVCHVCAFHPLTFNSWQWAAQALAEHGYVVMYADVLAADSLVSASIGMDFWDDVLSATVAATDYFVSRPDDPSPHGVNEYNPWHARLDPTRLGIAGHSGAAGASFIVGHTDDRFDAVVAWDRAGPSVSRVEQLRTPTMVHLRDFVGDGTPPDAKPVPEPGSKESVPVTLEGLSIRNRLSLWWPTRYFLAGGALECENVRAGCADGTEWHPGDGRPPWAARPSA